MLTRPLVLVFASSFGSSTSFYLLLSVVSIYAASVGAGGTGAGLATGALMLSTVAAELLTPLLLYRFDYRAVFAAGLVLLGAPSFALGFAPTLVSILAVCLARGFGLGIVLVAGGALVAELVPPERRGEGLGLYGVAVGVPFVVALPMGVWLAETFGYPPVFAAGGLAALAGLAAIPGLPGRAWRPGRTVGVLGALRNTSLLGPLAVFFVVAMAAGIVVTFVLLVVPGGSGNLAAAALLIQAAAATLFRWWTGCHGDRYGPASLLVPAVVASAVGVLVPAFAANPAAVLAGVAILGAGWGVSQNVTLALMLERVAPPGYGAASAPWYVAYDAGLGLGAVGFGVAAVLTGYSRRPSRSPPLWCSRCSRPPRAAVGAYACDDVPFDPVNHALDGSSPVSATRTTSTAGSSRSWSTYSPARTPKMIGRIVYMYPFDWRRRRRGRRARTPRTPYRYASPSSVASTAQG